MLKRLPLTATLVCLALAATTATASAQIETGGEVVLRPTFNTSRVVYVEVGGAVISYEHDDSRLFPVAEATLVRIAEIKANGSSLEVEYVHTALGKGRLKAELRGAPDVAQARQLILWHAFHDPSEPDLYEPFVANEGTGVLHFVGSNHLPAQEQRTSYASLEHALADGHHRCSVCFYETPRVSNYYTERQLGTECASRARAYYPVVTEDAPQQRLDALGAAVLADWPLPLKGYPYSFELVHADIANAMACPGGYVMVTTGLLDVIEDDRELASVLAHEIGHVELRHGYRQLKSAKQAALWGGLAAAFAGAATKDSDVGIAVAGVTAAVAGLASTLVLSGYSRNFEMESDSLASIYVQSHSGTEAVAPIAQVLRKMNYSAQVRSLEAGDGDAFASHPHLSDRIDRAETSEVRPTPGAIFHGLDGSGRLIAVVEFVLQSVTKQGDGRGLELLAAVETTALLGDKDEIKDIRLRHGGRDLKLDNKEDTEIWPSDGAGVIFRTDKVTEFLDEISGLQLNLNKVKSWRQVGGAE